MSTALLIVDYQKDFLPGGALGVEGGDEVRSFIAKRASKDDIDLIVLSRDWHPKDHISFSLYPEYRDGSWPPHCVQDSDGAKLDPELLSALHNTAEKPIVIVTKGDEADNETYSAFDGRINLEDPWGEFHYQISLADSLKQHGIDRVIVVGLALDYCVRETALDAVLFDYETFVPLNGTRAVDQERGRQTIELLRRANVQVGLDI